MKLSLKVLILALLALVSSQCYAWMATGAFWSGAVAVVGTLFGTSINSVSNFCANGEITSTATPTANRLVVGGYFTKFAPCNLAFYPMDNATGALSTSLPFINAVTGGIPTVAQTMVSDGSGGIYVGGMFDSINGVSRTSLAHVFSTGTVDSSWNPSPTFAPVPSATYISVLALSGSTLYVGGLFTSIGGATRTGIAALTASTGNATSWNPSISLFGTVNQIVPTTSTIIVSGGFTTIGGRSNPYLAALNTTTASATTWKPNPNDPTGGGQPVSKLAFDGANNLYVLGYFTTIGGQSRNGIALINTTTSSTTTWNINPDIPIMSMFVSNSLLYVGGYFSTVAGQARSGLAAINSSGTATSWNPMSYGVITAIAPTANGILTSGAYLDNTTFTAGLYMGNYSMSTGAPLSGWDPINIGVSIAPPLPVGNVLYNFGYYLSGAAVSRKNLAAIDTTTNTLTDWNPGVDGGVNTILVNNNTVYVGGYFNNLGGQYRPGIGAVDATTGLATSFNPAASSGVMGMKLYGSTLYVTGNFTTIGGQSRNMLAALDATTGTATTWNPSNDASYMHAIDISGTTLYVGGTFTSMGGSSRNNIAAFDLTTGNVTSWNPNADQDVEVVTALNNKVYAGGFFSNIGGQARLNAAELDPSTGLATSWAPYFDSYPQYFAYQGAKLFAAGNFNNVNDSNGNNTEPCVVTLDSSGAVTETFPNCGPASLFGYSGVNSLSFVGNTLYVGGGVFNTDYTSGRQGIIGFDLTTGNVVW